MSDIFDVGDPYLEWNEEISAREDYNTEEKENMFDVSVLKDDVVKILMTRHSFLVDDAEEAVKESFEKNPDMWSENADADQLANYLASDDGDDVL